MIELPEAVTISRQLHSELQGKKIATGNTGNSPHKWIFYKPSREEIEKTLPAETVSKVHAVGRSIHFTLNDRYVLVVNDFGGKVLYHEAGKQPPKKYHLLLQFDDRSLVTVAIQGWGFFEILKKSDLSTHDAARAGALSPTEKTFTLPRFRRLFDGYEGEDTIKTFFTNGKNVAGIGNGYLQDILFRARISPKRKVRQITPQEIAALHRSVQQTIDQAVQQNGRACEQDIHGNPGQYTPLMDRNATGKPCPECGTPIQKISYLGGSCYLCPSCQT